MTNRKNKKHNFPTNSLGRSPENSVSSAPRSDEKMKNEFIGMECKKFEGVDVSPPDSETNVEKIIKVNPGFKPKSMKTKKHFFPIVSVCTPTFNRRPFIPIMFECFKNQDYPKNAIEWIIVDDGTDPVEDLVKESNIENIKYVRLSNKCPLGKKRNIMHTYCTGSIIVYMDDDDYYPPERISHAVERLNQKKEALCAGSSEIYIYFKHISKMVQCGPYNDLHATAGTFAFRKELLKQTRYEDTAALAEEKSFLKNYTIPFVQLDPMKTILVFSHKHNTFDKKRLLENMHPEFCKYSPKNIEDFIRNSPVEDNIKKFFIHDIEEMLHKYLPGEPAMKPDVLQKIKEIEIERENMAKAHMNENNQGKIMFQSEGGVPIELQPEQIIQILQQNQQQMQNMMNKINEQEEIIKKLTKLLYDKSRNLSDISENSFSDALCSDEKMTIH
jgi:glycosyltransferase involved in cell wall biosynthesis